jgi:uncharacterized protein YbbK (DUF523 family)
VLKRNSPSCGLSRVEVAQLGGESRADGSALFAAELLRVMSELPVIEEKGLVDPGALERFVERVQTYQQQRAELR